MFFEEVIPYEGTVIRPPSEADSLIFQITIGCSDNKCNFCPAYKDKRFKIKSLDQIKDEFIQASRYFNQSRKLFFADGDAIAIPNNELIKIMELANQYFPKLSRIGIYGSIKSLKNKSIDDLIELKRLKLGIIYLGIETGDARVYALTNKYGSPKKNMETCLKIKKAGIKLNTTIILGLGGKKYSEDHVKNTASVLNYCQPDQVAALTLMVVKNTPLYVELMNKKFELPSELELIKELYEIISSLNDFRCLFFSNHASNYYPINARFPRDKEKVISDLHKIISKNNLSKLRPEFFRAL